MRKNSSVRAHRTLHLIDADNLIGDPCTVDTATITATFAEYRRVAGFVDGDHVVVATGVNGLHVLEVEQAWPNARHRRRRGPDGADLELLNELDFAIDSGRYDRVVIGSGDRIFLIAVEALVAAGVEFHVVSRPGALARALAVRANGSVRYLADVAQVSAPGAGRAPVGVRPALAAPSAMTVGGGRTALSGHVESRPSPWRRCDHRRALARSAKSRGQ